MSIAPSPNGALSEGRWLLLWRLLVNAQTNGCTAVHAGVRRLLPICNGYVYHLHPSTPKELLLRLKR